MRKTFIFLMAVLFTAVSFAQDNGDKKDKKNKKEKTEKTRDKKDRDKKDRKDKDDNGFIYDVEDSEDYQKEERAEVSKPQMPLYDIEQPFNTAGKKKKKQQNAYMDKDYYFPSKPKNAWQLGIRGGIATSNGDINQNFFKGNKPFVPGYTFGLNVKKPFSYMFSMRLNYAFSEMWNTDWQPSTLTTDYINGTGLAGYNADGSVIFYNAHTIMHDMTMDAIISFGNVRFHKERTKVIFNAFLSAGGMGYQTFTDQYDADGNPYDYSNIPNPSTTDVSKSEVIKMLNEMRNGVYETTAEGHPDTKDASILGGYNFRPVFGGGFGMSFRLGKIVNLDIESKQMFTRDDLFDGMRWQEPNSSISDKGSRSLTRDFDTYNQTTVGLVFNLKRKKGTEPTTWLNPMHYTYQKLAEADPEKAIEDLLKDDDEDGVPNRLDQEEDTPKDCGVDPKGRALDSDKDGLIDCEDQEPFSPPGFPVDEVGVAAVPSCCDEETGGYACDVTALPSVHFDNNKFNIQPEFYSHLHTIGEKMMMCPDMKVVATGMTDGNDNEKYNEQLSWKRSNAVIEYLEENYGIERSRFIMEYDGESNSDGSTTIEKYRDRKVSLRVAEEGESGESNPAEPHPGLNVGSDK